LLKERLSQHGVPESPQISPRLIVTALTVTALAAVVFCYGLALHDRRGVDGRWVVLGAMIVGGFATWLLEKTYIPGSTRVGRPIILK
jgi:hypothetical protein